jgi:hypothetical protein
MPGPISISKFLPSLRTHAPAPRLAALRAHRREDFDGDRPIPAKVALICAARVAVALFEGEIATRLTGLPRRGRSARLKPAEQKGTIFNEHEKMLLL